MPIPASPSISTTTDSPRLDPIKCVVQNRNFGRTPADAGHRRCRAHDQMLLPTSSARTV
jgi:hypothetical protein